MTLTFLGLTFPGMKANPRTQTPILKRRQARSLSGYALARAVGTTPSHIARIERGESCPNVELAIRIADALGADVRELFPRRAA